MDVLVVRHGIAMDREEAESAGVADADRPLTHKGRLRLRRSVRGLARRVPDVSSLITSPLRRALETSDVLLERFRGLPATESDTLLPHAEPAALAELLAYREPDPVVAVVGHEPHLSQWVSWCLTGQARSIVELRKGGACLLRFDAQVGPSQGRLLWLMTPAVLRGL